MLDCKSLPLAWITVCVGLISHTSFAMGPHSQALEAAQAKPELQGCAMTIALDTSKSKDEPRLYVYEAEGRGKVSGPFYAGHGKGSDPTYNGKINVLADDRLSGPGHRGSWSNSNVTPGGAFEVWDIGQTFGKSGRGLGTVMRLKGLEASNRSAQARGFYMHMGIMEGTPAQAIKKSTHGEAYVSAMKDYDKSGKRESYCDWTSGCISVSDDANPEHGQNCSGKFCATNSAGQKVSQWQAVLEKALSYRKQHKRVCVYVAPLQGTPAKPQPVKKAAGENRAVCAQKSQLSATLSSALRWPFSHH